MIIIIKPINEFADAKELGKFDYIIIGASTWGDGDVAPGTEDIFEYIFNSDTDLSKTYLSYFGLGDKKYNEYNTAIVYIEEKITKNLDGKRIGKILQIDGYPNSENINIAVNWASENIELFNKKNT